MSRVSIRAVPVIAARVLVALALLAGPARAQDKEACLVCHSDAGLTKERHGRTVSLHVDPAVFGASVHKDLACVDCHAGFKPDDLPHLARIRPVDCTACHGDIATTHRFHMVPGPDGKPGLPAGQTCVTCHGTHDIASLADPKSPGNRAHRLALCGRCHSDVVERFRESAHGRAFESGGAGVPDCLVCHNTPITKRQVTGDEAALKIAQEKVCLSCHLDSADVRARMAPKAGFIAAYEKSVHGAALLRGDGRAANCVDCHGSHEMERGYEGNARVNKQHIPETCGRCHAEIAATYAESVHGRAVARGNHEAPVCTGCHGEHDIMKARDPRSPVAAGNVSAQVCSPCHSSVRMERKYGIDSDRFKTFSDSYHGMAIRGGDVEVANCASCHGSHDILPPSDPRSRVNKANLAVTCGRCHPGANARFAVGSVHVVATPSGDRILYWIATAYLVLIVGTIGGMLIHNLLDFLRRGRHLLRRRAGLGDEAPEPAGRGLYLRMTLSERLQHGALLLSFATLVVTGFMLHYPDSWWVVGLRRLDGGLFQLRSRMHRVAGVVLLLASTWHLIHIAFTRRGREFVRDMVPRPRDLADALGVLRYNLGLTPHKPRFGRFSYVEKSEYWALVWGTIVMGVTGAVLWFENAAMSLLTKLGWDIARTVHFYEAWLATLAILVWHLYYVVFNPDVYPMSTSWLTGTISEREMLEEHPLELEAMERAKREEAARQRVAGQPVRGPEEGGSGGSGA
jgi:cytochrome b subunit of formate dehydrogenase